MVSRAGLRWSGETAGSVRPKSVLTYSDTDIGPFVDFILAAADVEGNFLVVKAYQYTDLLSCMLLDAYVLRCPR